MLDISRRELITLLGGAAAWPPAFAQAQQSQKVPRVGILTPAQTDATPIFEAFRRGLRDLGYVDGKNIILDFRFAKGRLDALPDLAAELVRIPVDVILADTSNAARAALDATRTIPIVLGSGGDPVLLGLAPSIGRPGGNFTGVTIRADVPSSKRMDLLKLAFPGIARVTILMNSKSPAAPHSLAAAEETARALGMHAVSLPIGTPDELRALNATHLSGRDALAVLPHAMFWNHRSTIIAVAEAARLPAIYPEREFADDGGLIAYGPNIPDNFRRASVYVDQILRGAKPGDFPFDEPARFDFIVNLRAARGLGLAISPNIVSTANEVIE
jgi:putative tryptophan/tyrosine transport system substrate-binding protein